MSAQTVKTRPKRGGFFHTMKWQVPVEKSTAIHGNLQIVLPWASHQQQSRRWGEMSQGPRQCFAKRHPRERWDNSKPLKFPAVSKQGDRAHGPGVCPVAMPHVSEIAAEWRALQYDTHVLSHWDANTNRSLLKAEKIWEQVITAVSTSSSKLEKENKTTQKRSGLFLQGKFLLWPELWKRSRWAKGTLKAEQEALQTGNANVLRNTLVHRSCTKLRIFEILYPYAHFTGARDPSTANKIGGRALASLVHTEWVELLCHGLMSLICAGSLLKTAWVCRAEPRFWIRQVLVRATNVSLYCTLVSDYLWNTQCEGVESRKSKIMFWWGTCPVNYLPS